MAHKFLALSENDRTRFDRLMSAFNLKDSRAAEYIRLMVRLYPGSGAGSARSTSRRSSSRRKSAAVRPASTAPRSTPSSTRSARWAPRPSCTATTTRRAGLDLQQDPLARAAFERTTKPQYLEAFEALLKRHPDVPMVWAHFMDNGRGVRPYPEHWRIRGRDAGRPAVRHVSIDISGRW